MASLPERVCAAGVPGPGGPVPGAAGGHQAGQAAGPGWLWVCLPGFLPQPLKWRPHGCGPQDAAAR